ncbi:MAG: glycosyltransferase [Nitrospirae bacterium]|nr:glycosyltransferase [Nitrospirota bacterium]MBF0533414.1 glycosyltransferase [Nitrospirota bacterium]MBF0616060.1 glycosyltransferase [Nitrospirota bacterium]
MSVFMVLIVVVIALYLLEVMAVRSYTSFTKPDIELIPDTFPAISIIKPLKGLEDGLFDNLESFCNQDYPVYEIIFTLHDQNDPAYKVVRKVKDKYCFKDISIIVEHCDAGLNPKVNNLIPAYRKAKYDLILISDSNIRVEKDYLADISRHMDDPSVGLVTNLIRGVGGRSFGAVMENLHLNSFVVGSVCILDKYLDMPCVIGKSILIRKDDLESIGGLTSVKDFLAEDYIIGQRIHALGKKIILSSHLINNVNEYWSLKRFINRHTRWGKLRWQIGGAKYFSELFSNAVFMAFILMFIMPLSPASILFAVAVSLLKIAHDIHIGTRLQAGMNPLLYLLSPVKDIIIGIIWFVPIFSNTINWRGNRYIIGKGSALSPLQETGLWLLIYRLFSIKKECPSILPDIELADK